MWHGVLHFLGIDNPAGPWYAWWSGAGSDLGEIVLVGGFWAGIRRLNCHEHRCWRVGRHKVEGTPFVVCRKHHPDIDHTKPLHVAEHPLTIAASSVSPGQSEAADE